MELLNPEIILEGLNPEQRQAVEHTDGPLLIQAGAGSGKTKTLTHRIAHLIATGRATTAEILAVTFTNKAADEMRERLANILHATNNRSFMPWMGTFHSIAVRLLRYYGDAINIPNNFVIYDETDKLTLVKHILKDLGATDKQFNPRTIASYISNAKNDCQTPDDYYRHAGHSPLQQMAAEVYRRYEQRMCDNAALDFDDLLLDTVKLLRESSVVREKLQHRFKYVLIDEYQDTNRAQYQIIKLILNKQQNICAVGDDWQSIYSWRGADFTNILNFERDFANTEVIKLEQNYRSTKEILEAAHNVITKNTQRSDKKLWTANEDGTPVEIIEARNEFDEADRIATKITAAIRVGSRNYRDFAVLYRTNAQSRVFEQMLLRDGVPYRIVGGLRFYDRAEIKDLTAYLKLIYQPRDIVSFARIVNVPKRGLGDVSVGKFMAWQADSGQDVLWALEHVNECPGIAARAKNNLRQLGLDLLDIKSQATMVTPDQVVTTIISRFKYDRYIDDGTDQGEAKQENIGELISMAKEYGDLASFLEEVALISGADVVNNDDAITLMTLHAAKGLEFPVVFMVGMEDGLFPNARAALDPMQMEEERRLCYVGMTRAREELYLSYANSRMMHGEPRFNMPSEFLADAVGGELPSSKLDGVDDEVSYDDFNDYPTVNYGARFHQGARHQSSYSFDNEPHFEPEQVNLGIGDKVRHQMFGVGQVTSIDGTVVEVYFNDGKTRKLNIAFAPLTKV
ncbi:MAG: UvrD-helicase domain-containing protein [Candidatus Saccharibacteria bacterium]|nr:UvrD-helicase domain-containing protein [Candidatus Saccharibacteria bacterium]